MADLCQEHFLAMTSSLKTSGPASLVTHDRSERGVIYRSGSLNVSLYGDAPSFQNCSWPWHPQGFKHNDGAKNALLTNNRHDNSDCIRGRNWKGDSHQCALANDHARGLLEKDHFVHLHGCCI